MNFLFFIHFFFNLTIAYRFLIVIIADKATTIFSRALTIACTTILWLTVNFALIFNNSPYFMYFLHFSILIFLNHF
jgi:hypothetical protein